jgi:hypothetical protein
MKDAARRLTVALADRPRPGVEFGVTRCAAGILVEDEPQMNP